MINKRILRIKDHFSSILISWSKKISKLKKLPAYIIIIFILFIIGIPATVFSYINFIEPRIQKDNFEKELQEDYHHTTFPAVCFGNDRLGD